MRRALPGSVALGLGSLAAVAFCLGPLGWQLFTSLRPEAELGALSLPSSLSLEAYRAVLRRPELLRAVANSALVAGGTTALCLSLASAAAFALARLPLRWGRWLLASALAVSMFPPIATVSPLFLIIRALGLRDTLTGLVLPYTTFGLPLSLWVLTGVFREIPIELYQSARVDGCTPFQAFRWVLLPLAMPGIATCGLLVFIASWNEFLYALTFTSTPENRTVPVALSLFATGHAEPWRELAAASILLTAPLVALALAFQRRIVAALTAGAVKG